MFLIAGADGFLGAYIQRELIEKNIPFAALNHRFCLHPDSEGIINVPFEAADPACADAAVNAVRDCGAIRVIYLAACHNPDTVKNNPEFAKKINSDAYSHFLEKISALPVERLVFSSSDTVYGESVNGKVFDVTDETVPVNAYGRQKLEAEKITRGFGFSCARLSYMYGASLTRKKHFYDEIREKLTRGEKIYMLTDYVRNALKYEEAARCLVSYALSDKAPDIVNIGSPEPVSKYDIGIIAADECGAGRNLVVPSTAAELGIFDEKRAASILMRCGKELFL